VTMKLRGPVLVGTDFTAASDEALRQGNDFANNLGTTLIVCHVVPELDTINVLFPQLAAEDNPGFIGVGKMGPLVPDARRVQEH